MTPWIEGAIAVAVGGLGGAVSGLLGLGGAAVITPLLAMLLAVDQRQAQAISLAALLPPVGLPAVLRLRKGGVRIPWGLVLELVVGFLVGAALGASVAQRASVRALQLVFAAFLVVTAVRAVRSVRGARAAPTPAASAPARVPPGVGVPIGLVGGGLSGLLGIGGGLVIIPLLRRFARVDQLEAQACTLAMMLPPVALPAVWVYHDEHGGLPWALLGALALGFVLGAALGARFALRLRGPRLLQAYAIVVVALSLVLVGKALVPSP